jgi:hypothetical protein
MLDNSDKIIFAIFNIFAVEYVIMWRHISYNETFLTWICFSGGWIA